MVKQRYLEMLKFLMSTLSSKFYFNYTLFHKNVSGLRSCASLKCYSSENEKVAIVIQGKIVEDDGFTLETLKIYKLIFPKAVLILSTWPDSSNVPMLARSMGVHVILSDPPLDRGCGNLNLQIVSTNAGLSVASNLGATYVLKTRTDQRIYNPSTIEYFLTLLKTFPLHESDKLKLNSRIIGISKGTFKYRIFGFSDMLQFGNLKDIKKYWDIRLNQNPILRSSVSPALVWKDQFTNPVPEVILFKNFLDNIGVRIEPTLKGTAVSFARFLIIVSHQDLGLYWNKYSCNQDWHQDFAIERYELDFLDWLIYYQSGGDIAFDDQQSSSVISGPRIAM